MKKQARKTKATAKRKLQSKKLSKVQTMTLRTHGGSNAGNG